MTSPNPCPPVDACACDAHCCIADTEIHYGFDFSVGDGPIFIDDNTRDSLSNRVTLELYNDGTVDFKYSTNKNMSYDINARTIKPNTSVSLAIGPTVRHYVLCSGSGCKLHVTTLGKTL